MSTIDDPSIIRKLIERKGSDGAFSFGRHCAYQIYEYVSGFGSKCYKLIYGLYAQSGDNDETAAAIFKATGNIKPGSTPTLIFKHGKLTAEGEKWWADKFGTAPSTELLHTADMKKCRNCGAETIRSPSPDCSGWCPGYVQE